MDKRVIVFVSLLVVIGMVVPTAAVCAKKPDKPPGGGGDDPTPTGTIFYTYNDGTGKAVWTMDADGSQDTELCSYTSAMGSLSRIKHGDHYWFIGLKDLSSQSYPDGLPRKEIYAVRDDGSEEVQLTNDATLATSDYGPMPVWGINDGYISWIAKRWVLTDTGWTLGKCGIWKQSITFDSGGDVTGLTGSLVLEWETDYWYSKSYDLYYPRPYSHDWSPDGKKIVYKAIKTGNPIYIVDTTTDTETYLTDGYDPQWSPDGNTIAFRAGTAHLKVIDTDGTGETTVVQVSPFKGWTTIIEHFTWSPDSNYLSYSIWKISPRFPFKYDGDIYTIAVDGSDNTCITKDLTSSAYKVVKDWR